MPLAVNLVPFRFNSFEEPLIYFRVTGSDLVFFKSEEVYRHDAARFVRYIVSIPVWADMLFKTGNFPESKRCCLIVRNDETFSYRNNATTCQPCIGFQWFCRADIRAYRQVGMDDAPLLRKNHTAFPVNLRPFPVLQ